MPPLPVYSFTLHLFSFFAWSVSGPLISLYLPLCQIFGWRELVPFLSPLLFSLSTCLSFLVSCFSISFMVLSFFLLSFPFPPSLPPTVSLYLFLLLSSFLFHYFLPWFCLLPPGLPLFLSFPFCLSLCFLAKPTIFYSSEEDKEKMKNVDLTLNYRAARSFFLDGFRILA